MSACRCTMPSLYFFCLTWVEVFFGLAEPVCSWPNLGRSVLGRNPAAPVQISANVHPQREGPAKSHGFGLEQDVLSAST